MAVDAEKMVESTLVDHLDPWANDGESVVADERAWPPGYVPAPERMDRLTAGPQHAFNRVWDFIKATRWLQCTRVFETLAETATQRPADIGIINSLAAVIFRHNAAKTEVFQWQDTVLTPVVVDPVEQVTLRQSKLEVQWTAEGAGTGSVNLMARIKVEDANGLMPADWSNQIGAEGGAPSYAGDGKVKVAEFDLGALVPGRLIRLQLELDTTVQGKLAAPVGVVRVRVL